MCACSNAMDNRKEFVKSLEEDLEPLRTFRSFADSHKNAQTLKTNVTTRSANALAENKQQHSEISTMEECVKSYGNGNDQKYQGVLSKILVTAKRLESMSFLMLKKRTTKSKTSSEVFENHKAAQVLQLVCGHPSKRHGKSLLPWKELFTGMDYIMQPGDPRTHLVALMKTMAAQASKNIKLLKNKKFLKPKKYSQVSL